MSDLWLDVLSLALEARRGAVTLDELELEGRRLEARAHLLDAHRVAFEARSLRRGQSETRA